MQDDSSSIKMVEHHIGCYPWRKDLFEYYGIRYKFKESKTCYEDFDKITEVKYGFSDINYTRFPYHEPLSDKKDEKGKENTEEIIGRKIYNRLGSEYNNAGYEDNTLVVYTMDAFLNEEQAGLCIVNFYHGITARMRQERCFCGERVGILVQENNVWEEEKDAKNQLDLPYSVGEIIQIGMNQATYLAMKDKINARDTFVKDLQKTPGQEHREEIERFIKGYVRNKGMRIYPNYPVFVDRMKNLLQGNILDPVSDGPNDICSCFNGKFFCLYHVMLRTLRYTNEVVVDISNNCLHALFWLGAAHSSDIHAITVMHEKIASEKKDSTGREPRYIFDVAGLWTAIFRKNDTEGFYQQLALAQHGIERQSKLMLSDNEFYKSEVGDYFSSFDRTRDSAWLIELEDKKKSEEKAVLESYYRTHFWSPMLSYNQLSIYVSHNNRQHVDSEPRISIAKWDFDAISELSNYLSKRKIIGEYKLATLDDSDKSSVRAEAVQRTNFICVGGSAQPLGSKGPGLSDYIAKELPMESKIHKWVSVGVEHLTVDRDFPAQLKGFRRINSFDEGYYTHIPQTQLKGFYHEHSVDSNERRDVIHSVQSAQISDFAQDIDGVHYEVAQLVLWREDAKMPYGYSHYWVSIAGNSGPATLALSTILTDEKQREEVCPGLAEIKTNFLCELQSEVRKKFMNIFREKLSQKMTAIAHCNGWNYADKEKAKQIEEYFGLVEYAVSFYLQTVLYRYFFPFLTPNDMERIHNGMYTVVNSMKAAKVSPFAPGYTAHYEDGFETAIDATIVREIVEEIPKVLLSVLRSFKGLETFYRVQVEHHLDDREKDTREIKSIKPMHPQIINYFVLDAD